MIERWEIVPNWYKFHACCTAQHFASCFLPSLTDLKFVLLHCFVKMNSDFSLPPFSTAFPQGLPEDSGPLPPWENMAFNDFAKSIRQFDLGVFEIPVANCNTHDLQRATEEEWLKGLKASLLKSKDADAHPGHALLNTKDLPIDSEGNTDCSKMFITVMSGGHRSTAVGRMDWPVEKKTWVFRIYALGMC